MREKKKKNYLKNCYQTNKKPESNCGKKILRKEILISIFFKFDVFFFSEKKSEYCNRMLFHFSFVFFRILSKFCIREKHCCKHNFSMYLKSHKDGGRYSEIGVGNGKQPSLGEPSTYTDTMVTWKKTLQKDKTLRLSKHCKCPIGRPKSRSLSCPNLTFPGLNIMT